MSPSGHWTLVTSPHSDASFLGRHTSHRHNHPKMKESTGEADASCTSADCHVNSADQEAVAPRASGRSSAAIAPRYRILAFYRFVPVPFEDSLVVNVRDELEKVLRGFQSRGTVLVACEGVNGTICYPLVEPEPENSEPCGKDQERCLSDPALSFLTERFPGLRTNISCSNGRHVFHRLKVRIKTEIVTMGCPEYIFDRKNSQDTDKILSSGSPDRAPLQAVNGTLISTVHEWNSLLLDPDCLVIDTRNEYEVALGTFRNAVNPRTSVFPEFPQWFDQYWSHLADSPLGQGSEGARAAAGEFQILPSTTLHPTPQSLADSTSRESTETAGTPAQGASNCSLSSSLRSQLPSKPPNKIAMFCTGGIRCEKASAYCQQKLSAAGIPVYHYEGGILSYLQQSGKEASDDCLFDGECYVFDQRVAVHGSTLAPSTEYTSCFACRHPLTSLDRLHVQYQEGISCSYCFDKGKAVSTNKGPAVSNAPRPLAEDNSSAKTSRAVGAKDKWSSEIRHRAQHQPSRQRQTERQKQITIANERGIQHIYDPKE
jgi:predicted sulfurtransferase